jgi:hypothetical protein
MKIVGCDLHTRYQQIAMLDAETDEVVERRLEHESASIFVMIRSTNSIESGDGRFL